MSEISEKTRDSNTVSKQEIEATLDRLFESVTCAIENNDKQKVTPQTVDQTLKALFEGINQAKVKGHETDIPDFESLIGESCLKERDV